MLAQAHEPQRAAGFNEAGGFLPRKPAWVDRMAAEAGASMRPGDFSPGNAEPGRRSEIDPYRFNEAGGFLPRKRVEGAAGETRRSVASMRPGDFSPGNAGLAADLMRRLPAASMRPGDFSPGNAPRGSTSMPPTGSRFNEAGGFLPRKLRSPGATAAPDVCFNEAGGFLPRKRIADPSWTRMPAGHASMRPGDFSPGNLRRIAVHTMAERRASMRPGDFSPGNI